VIVEGIVQGHRDGYGIVVTEGQADVYLPPQQMRGVLHLDRVRVRVVRQDRRGRAEGQLIEIVERSARPVIGRLDRVRLLLGSFIRQAFRRAA